jgi:hypothetical protein
MDSLVVWVLLIILLVLVGITVAAIALGARKRPDTCRPAQRVVRPKWLSFKFGGNDAAQTAFVNGLNNGGDFAQSRTNLIACEDGAGQNPGLDRANAVQRAIEARKIDRYLFRVLNPAMQNDTAIVAELGYGDPAQLITIQANAIAEIALQLPPAASVRLLDFLAEGAGGGNLGGINGAIAIIQAMVSGWNIPGLRDADRLEPRDRHDPAPDQAAMMLVALKSDNIFKIISGDLTSVQIASMLATVQVSPNLVTALNNLSDRNATKTAQIFDAMAAIPASASRAAALLANMTTAQAAQVLADGARRAGPVEGTLTAEHAAAILAASVDGNIPALGNILDLLVANDGGLFHAANIFNAMAVNPASAPRAAALLASMTAARAAQVLADGALRNGPRDGTLLAANAAVILAASDIAYNVQFGLLLNELVAIGGDGCFHAARIFDAMALASAARAAVLLANMTAARAEQVLADAATRNGPVEGTLTAAHAAAILDASDDANNAKLVPILNSLITKNTNRKFRAAKIFNEMGNLVRAAALLANLAPAKAAKVLADGALRPIGGAAVVDGTLLTVNAAAILAASDVTNNAKFGAILDKLVANDNSLYHAAKIFDAMAASATRAAALLAKMQPANAATIIADAAIQPTGGAAAVEGTLTAVNAAAILAASDAADDAAFGTILDKLTPIINAGDSVNLKSQKNNRCYKAAILFDSMAPNAASAKRAAVLLVIMQNINAGILLGNANASETNKALIFNESDPKNDGSIGKIIDAASTVQLQKTVISIFMAMVPARAAAIMDKCAPDKVANLLALDAVANATPATFAPNAAAAIINFMHSFAALNALDMANADKLYVLTSIMEHLQTSNAVKFLLQTPLDKNIILAEMPVSAPLYKILQDPSLPGDLVGKRLAKMKAPEAVNVIINLPDDQALQILASMDATIADAILAAAAPAALAAAGWDAQSSRLRDLRAPEEPTPSVAWHSSAPAQTYQASFSEPVIWTASETKGELSAPSAASALAAASAPAAASAAPNATAHQIIVIRPADGQAISSLGEVSKSAGAIPASVKYVIVFEKAADGASSNRRHAAQAFLLAQLQHSIDNKNAIEVSQNIRNTVAGMEGLAWLCEVKRGDRSIRLQPVATA